MAPLIENDFFVEFMIEFCSAIKWDKKEWMKKTERAIIFFRCASDPGKNDYVKLR
jgi:hypothetical protein